MTTVAHEWLRRFAGAAAIGSCAAGIVTVALAFHVTDASGGGAVEATSRSVAPVRTEASDDRDRAIATSFGTLAVHEPQLTRGVSARALAGQSHGINDYVSPERMLVQVPVTLYNASDDAVRYDSADFDLVLRAPRSRRDAGTARLASSSMRAGSLASGTAIDADLAFVVRRTGADMDLRFRDADGTVRRVPIGDAGPVYRPRVGDHALHGSGHSHGGKS